ncbi:hypothetical protein NUW54_g11776 [Trametes sanguinea]|uniref:Uncharacterized protein n=1 Tax=Trametes sanguinea TaxID=158606 RepID=A0ACC1N9J9_9APHY|nr:hypothetical protein NUW54_g11776 [Trametes sanguinea]
MGSPALADGGSWYPGGETLLERVPFSGSMGKIRLDPELEFCRGELLVLSELGVDSLGESKTSCSSPTGSDPPCRLRDDLAGGMAIGLD